jgi:hypothetical protein
LIDRQAFMLHIKGRIQCEFDYDDVWTICCFIIGGRTDAEFF